MNDARSRDGIVWERYFPLPALLRAMRLGAGPRALFLALIGLWLTQLGWWAGNKVIGGDPVSRSDASTIDDLDIRSASPLPSMPMTCNPPPTRSDLWETPPLRALRESLAAWRFLSQPLLNVFHPETRFAQCVFFSFCSAWAILVWSFFGTMIARGAAVALARDERLSGRRIGSFAIEKWRAVFAAPFTPLLGIGLLTIPLAILGMLLLHGFGVLVAGVLWPLALAAALAMTVLAAGLLLGWPLMWAAIAVEGSDSFDAVSRAYAYVFHRPLLLLWHGLLGLVIGAIGCLLVQLFCSALLTLCAWGVSWGAAGPPERIFASPEMLRSDAGWLGVKLIRFWTRLVLLAPVAFSFSYLWTASTAIYFSLRYEVDGAEFDAVYLPEENESPRGLPPLGADEAGVPKVED